MTVTIIRRSLAPVRKAMQWGAEIRKLRGDQRMSQRRLAKLAGVDRASLLRFESGKSQ